MKTYIDYSSVARVLGYLLIAEGVVMLVPLAVALVEGCDVRAFGYAAVSSLVVGFGLSRRRHSPALSIHRREAFMLVSVSWVVFSFVGMIPYMLCSHPLGVSDAFFETMSGFTTTGATTISNVEQLSRAILLWRSITQWIGGLGILLFILAILPALNAKGGIPIYNAESSGITHSKLHSRIRQTALSLWSVYIMLTLALIALLWAGPMDLFDSVCHAFCTISTGGFSTRNQGIAFWGSGYVDWVLTAFMFVGGVNFGLLYMLFKGNPRPLLGNDVLRLYAFIVVLSYGMIAAALAVQGQIHSVYDALTAPMFHVVSAITSTGFADGDFASWGAFALIVTMLLMICGACAGSTSGALKVDRVDALRKNLANEIRHALYPKRVYSVTVNCQVVPPDNMKRITAFATIYALLIIAGAMFTSAFGVGVVDSFFAAISCLGNNGLGYGVTGCAGGYGLLPDAAKWAMSFLMLAGRLELFSVLVMFLSAFWRK